MVRKLILASTILLSCSAVAQDDSSEPIYVTGKTLPIVISAKAIDRSLLSPMGLAIVRWANGEARTASTAFLISKCYALTTRRAFGDDTDVTGRYVEFWSGVSGRPSQWKGHFAQVVATGSEPAGSSASAGSDWLLLRVKSCPGKKYGTVRLDPSPPTLNRRYILASFPPDAGFTQGPLIDADCRILTIAGTLATHHCADHPGQSGSPIFRIDDDKGHKTIVVVAVLTSGTPPPSGGHDDGLPHLNMQTADQAILASSLAADRRINQVIARNADVVMPRYPGNVTYAD